MQVSKQHKSRCQYIIHDISLAMWGKTVWVDEDSRKIIG